MPESNGSSVMQQNTSFEAKCGTARPTVPNLISKPTELSGLKRSVLLSTAVGQRLEYRP